MNRPRPVLTSAGITGAVQAVATIVGWLGYTNAETNIDGMTQTLVAVVLGILTLGGSIVHGLAAQAKVTPLSDPQLPAMALVTSVGEHEAA